MNYDIFKILIIKNAIPDKDLMLLLDEIKQIDHTFYTKIKQNDIEDIGLFEQSIVLKKNIVDLGYGYVIIIGKKAADKVKKQVEQMGLITAIIAPPNTWLFEPTWKKKSLEAIKELIEKWKNREFSNQRLSAQTEIFDENILKISPQTIHDFLIVNFGFDKYFGFNLTEKYQIKLIDINKKLPHFCQDHISIIVNSNCSEQKISEIKEICGKNGWLLTNVITIDKFMSFFQLIQASTTKVGVIIEVNKEDPGSKA